ncbi:insulinase family protein [bacterium]|nr:MAG: insulinase family protein [bacterium]
MLKRIGFTALSLMISGFSLLQAQNLKEFEKKVTKITLDNGLRILVVERHEAPVASFLTYVNVGSADEPIGKSGIAHIFEHMAFKGSSYIGTTDYKSEKMWIDKTESAYKEWLQLKNAAVYDSAKVQSAWTAFKAAQDSAKQFVVNNEFSQIIDREGGVGLNASTGSDQTMYYYSLPSNKVELWFNLEAERFKDPVFREFYVEKDVVKEERRMRTDSSPIGRLIEEFLAVGYTAHPYGISGIGWPSDIEATTITDAHDFYKTHYVPSNMVIAIAGDVYPDQIKKLAESYFGDIPAGNPAPKTTIKEPKQRGERRFVIEEQSQPWYIEGYHTVAYNHPDSKALDMMSAILSGGRTSRLYKVMVEEKQQALTVGAFNGFPGSKYETMFLNYALPNQDVTVEELEKTIAEEIQKVKDGDVKESELDRAKTNARASLIRSLGSNTGLAIQLAQSEILYGDWKAFIKEVDEIQRVTLDDIKRVANTYLIKNNRTVGIIKKTEEKTAEAK